MQTGLFYFTVGPAGFVGPKKVQIEYKCAKPVVSSLTSGDLVPTKHVNNSPVTLLGHKVVHVAKQGGGRKRQSQVVIFSRHFF